MKTARKPGKWLHGNGEVHQLAKSITLINAVRSDGVVDIEIRDLRGLGGWVSIQKRRGLRPRMMMTLLL